MTVATVGIIMGRIKSAEADSPIAVFVQRDRHGYSLDAVFARTAAAEQRIKRSPHSLVGVYHRHHHHERVRMELMRAEGMGRA